MKNLIYSKIYPLIAVAVLAAGCGSEQAAQPTVQAAATLVPTFTPLPPTPTPQEAESLEAQVVVSSVKLRSGPGTDYEYVTSSYKGNTLIVTGRDENGEWIEVSPDGERTGWVPAKTLKLNVSDMSVIPEVHVTPLPTPTPTRELDAATLTIDAANVRSGPGTDYEVVDFVYANKKYAVAGRNEDGSWVKLSLDKTDEEGNEVFGWVSSTVLETNFNLDEAPVAEDIPAPEAAEETEEKELKMPTCSRVPIRGFGTVWGNNVEVAATLGCPYDKEEGVDAAVQNFEHGVIVMAGHTIFVLFDDGSVQYFSPLGEADPAAVKAQPPAGKHAPGESFSKVYWEGTGARVSERLGWATTPQYDSPGAVQSFRCGYMLWTQATDRIYVLYNYRDYKTYEYIRTWESFEDKF